MAKAERPNFEQVLTERVAGYRRDPLGYVMFAFPWGEGELVHAPNGPREWQRKQFALIGSLMRAGMQAQEAIQIAICSGHGPGKSAFLAMLTMWAISTCVDARGVITANTERQLRTKTWPELAKWHRLAINSHWFDLQATSLSAKDPKHSATWRMDIIPWSENNTEAFAGLHNQGRRILVIYDEASAIPDKIWEVTEGALTDEATEIIWCAFGNGTRATGRFRDCFGKYRHRWHTEQIDTRTVEGTNKVQIAKWVEDHGEDSDFVKVRVRGMFPSMSVKQFIAVEDVDAAFGRHLRQEQYTFAPVVLTCDPAWEGDDELVIGKRQGLRFDVLRAFGKNDNDIQVANLLANLEDEHGADAVFIDAGYGTGIHSAGKTMGRTWQLVWFSGKAADPGCMNKRAEMWRDTRNWLKEGGAIPKDNTLYQDLIGPETVARLDGKIQLESKDDMKARGLPSPNRGDALALSFAFPVASKAGTHGHGRSAGRARIDEDEDAYA